MSDDVAFACGPILAAECAALLMPNVDAVIAALLAEENA